MRPEEIAAICHAANRALTECLRDVPVQPEWDDAPEDMKLSSIRGVMFAINNPKATAEDQHRAWMDDKISSGWEYGPEKSDVMKTHPSLKPFGQLPDGVRTKDVLFRAIIKALTQDAERVL